MNPELSPVLLSCFLFVISHSCSLLTTRYKFRIKAENAYGISDESQESDPFDVNQPIAGELLSIIQSSVKPRFDVNCNQSS